MWTSVFLTLNAALYWAIKRILSSFGGWFQLLASAASFLLVLVGWLGWYCIFWPTYFSPLRNIPTPSSDSVIFGNFWRLLYERNGDNLKHWEATVPNNGLIRYMDLFGSERLAVLNSKALSEILVQKTYEFIKPPRMASGLGRILGFGLFLSEGDAHKWQRKNLQPAFAYAHLKSLYPSFLTKSEELVTLLESQMHAQKSDKSSLEVEVGSWATRATLDIIGVAGLGQDFGALQDPSTELNVTYNKLFAPGLAGKIFGILGFFLPARVVRNLPMKRNNDIFEASSIIKRHCMSLITKQREKSKTGHQTRSNILSVALASSAFTDEDMVNQLMTFLVAGHETGASAFTWAVYALCQYPEVQTRLRLELLNDLPGGNQLSDEATSEDIDRLPYLRAFCNEVLRVFTPIPLTIRVAAQDTSLVGYHIPKGTAIMIPPGAVNTSTKEWGEDAAEFKPDRWLGPGKGNSGGAHSNYAFMTFLHGPRSCIGQKFATAELACLVATWVRAFVTRFSDPNYVLDVRNGITSRPKLLMVKVESVDQ